VRAFVTGGKGFVGTWLLAHLQASGDDVVAVDREVDVTDRRAVAAALEESTPDAVYHLAAHSHVGRSWDDPEAVFRVNALGTLHLLEAARRLSRPPRVLLVSSAEVYGVIPEHRLPADEDTPLAPVSPYAASKVAAEFLGLQAHLAHGLPVVRARPFNHIGPGQHEGFVVPSLAKRIVEARRSGTTRVPVGNLSPRRDLTDVRDVVRAYRLLVEHGVPGDVYNICSGHAVSIAELAARMVELSGGGLELDPDPDLVRPVDVPVLCGAPDKLRAVTRWEPRVEVEASLADVLAEWERRVP
jgi:GDP-4-dehydro-6-deoxy-D-mannose reductase